MRSVRLPDVSGPPALTPQRRTMRIDQLMLVGTVTLVVAIVALSGVLQALTARNELDESARVQQARLETQAREIERLVAHLLSITSAASLRDNNYAFLADLVGPLVGPEILRVRILDRDKHVVADTEANAAATAAAAPTPPERRWTAAQYRGRPVLEYVEPIELEHRAQGSVIVTYSLEPLHNEVVRLRDVERSIIRRITMRTFILGVSFVLLGVVLAAFQSRRVTQPLGALTREALRLARGELHARVPQTRKAGMEVFTLGTVFNHMADQISVLLAEARLRAQLDHQMQVARAVQESLLPLPTPVAIGRLRLAGVVAPADQCGGDWWSYLSIDERRLCLCVGDVTGHGLSTALIAAAACSGFVSSVDRVAGPVDVAHVMRGLNRTIFVMGRGEYQMTCTAAIIDVQSGAIEACNGGHPFPLVFNRVTRQTHTIVAKGPRVGDALESTFACTKAKLEPGDVVLWFSDGLVEAENAQKVQFGAKRLRQALERYAHLPAEQLREAVMAEVALFTDTVAQADDIMLVVAEFLPPAGAS